MCSRALVTVSDVSTAEDLDLSPEQRKRAHAAKYEAEFDVVLDMTDASYRSKGLGIVLDYEVDYVPVHVTQIDSNGIQAEWNTKHPNKQLLAGDQITRVNDYVWHSNSNNFLKRISGLVRAGRTLDVDSEETMSMHILRPRREKHAHTQMYETEFVAELPIPDAHVSGNPAAIMGWELNSTVASQPVSVSKIKQEGVVAEWNKANPGMMIMEGDEIIKVNDLQDQNSRVSEARIVDQIEASRSTAPGAKRTLGLAVRRPRREEAKILGLLERATPAQEAPSVDPASPKQPLEVSVRFPQPTSNMPALKAMGWKLAIHGDSGRVVVKNVEKEGLLAQWNAEHPSMAVEPSDQVIQVDGAVWKEGSNPGDFLRKIAEALTAASLEGPGRALRLALAKPARVAPALSPGWESTVDVATGKVYYFNRQTGQSSWTPV